MSIEVFWGSGSPYSWRALLALEAKRLPYESRLLEFSKRQNRAPEYLALNPRGKVPTLRDGDTVVYESLAILTYLEAEYPEHPLFGRSPRETANIWREISECLYYVEPRANAVVGPLYFGGVAEKAKEIQEAAEALRGELSRLEAAAGRGRFLAGDALSAADLFFFPFLMSLARAASKEASRPLELGLLPLAERYPALDRWRQRIEALPGYERTYPPHWK